MPLSKIRVRNRGVVEPWSPAVWVGRFPDKGAQDLRRLQNKGLVNILSQEQTTLVVKVEGMSPRAFRAFLWLVYTGILTRDDIQTFGLDKVKDFLEDLKAEDILAEKALNCSVIAPAQDSAGQAKESAEETTSETSDKAGELGSKAQDSAADAGSKAEDKAGELENKVSGLSLDDIKPSGEGPGFGAAGKDVDIKAPAGNDYGSADDKFVTRTQYPSADKTSVTAAGDVNTGEGTLASLKSIVAGI